MQTTEHKQDNAREAGPALPHGPSQSGSGDPDRGVEQDKVVSRAEARKLSRASGQHQEPYRGYAHQLKDGRQVYCAPDGLFRVRAALALAKAP